MAAAGMFRNADNRSTHCSSNCCRWTSTSVLTPRRAISHAAITVFPKAVVAVNTPVLCATIASAAARCSDRSSPANATSSRRCSAADAVRRYKSLAQVERAFRCLKGIDLRILPIHHRSADHVRAHILICMLAYYVEWHMRRALAPLLFEDEELPRHRRQRDPVAPPQPSASALQKKLARVTADGFPVQSFHTLLEILGTRCRNLCRIRQPAGDATFQQLTLPTALQARAFDLLGV